MHTHTHTCTHTHSRLLMKVVPSQKEGAGFPHWLMTQWGNSCRCLCIITCYAVLPLTLHCCSHLRSPTASQNGLLKIAKHKRKKVSTLVQRHVGIQMSRTPHPDIWHKDKRTAHTLQQHSRRTILDCKTVKSHNFSRLICNLATQRGSSKKEPCTYSPACFIYIYV